MSISWKDMLHYGAALVCVAAGGLTEVGMQIPGVVVSDPKAVIAAGIGVFAAGLKGGITSGKS